MTEEKKPHTFVRILGMFNNAIGTIIAVGALQLFLNAGNARLIEANAEAINENATAISNLTNQFNEHRLATTESFGDIQSTLSQHDVRFDSINTRFDDVNSRLDSLDGRLINLENGFLDLSARVARVEGSLGVTTNDTDVSPETDAPVSEPIAQQ